MIIIIIWRNSCFHSLKPGNNNINNNSYNDNNNNKTKVDRLHYTDINLRTDTIVTAENVSFAYTCTLQSLLLKMTAFSLLLRNEETNLCNQTYMSLCYLKCVCLLYFFFFFHCV